MKKQLKKSEVLKHNKTLPQILVKRLSEGSFILLITFAFFILLSLITWHITDPGFIHGEVSSANIINAGGQVGAYIADFLYLIFGYLAYLLPIYFVYIASVILKDHRNLMVENKILFLFRFLGLILLLIGGSGIMALEWQVEQPQALSLPGGIVGHYLAYGLSYALNVQGATLLLSAAFLIGITWFTGLSWIQIVEMTGFITLSVTQFLWQACKIASKNIVAFNNKIKLRKFEPKIVKAIIVKEPKKKKLEKPREAAKLLSPENLTSPPLNVRKKVEVAEITTNEKVELVGSLPTTELLEPAIPGTPFGGYTHPELETLSRDVEQYLLDFGIQADVVSVHPGPVITLFELQLAAGVKASKLTALSKDLARSLSVTSVRVVEIIPGKTVVGIELPNQNRAMVRLSEVLSADIYQKALSPLTLALGVDIAGDPMIVDLAKMPHLLVAGTTGSGKSVGINAMILSLLFKASPEEVRLIMVDPKMLELSVYDGIPHLLTPVVTDMKEAQSALRWCVGEMERRYRLMAALGVRNLAGFNNKIKDAKARNEPIFDPLFKPEQSMDPTPPELQTLPYIVVIIDELADMMMVVGKKVEQLIARIAQKARAAGIHLILATQRPSVDVLTGLIKSNIPTRISFQVSSKIDSRTILDQQGAEQLLGHGDMLFLAPGTGAPIRVHGAFVDDKEVHNVADNWRARGTPDYIEDITELTSDSFDNNDEDQEVENTDALYDQVVEFVLQTRKTSISAVQRRFKIGYNRAARLVEEMERVGIIGPLEGGARDILINDVTNYGE